VGLAARAGAETTNSAIATIADFVIQLIITYDNPPQSAFVAAA
jgi:hypothetical protein